MRAFFSKKRIWLAMAGLCGCLALGALVYIGSELILYITARKEIDNAGRMYEQAQSKAPLEVPLWTPSQTEPGTAVLPVPLSTPVPAEVTEEERLRLSEEKGRIQYADMLAANPDYRGMMFIEGLGVQLPYVQGEDNEKYLNTSFFGKKSSLGAVFMSAYNDPWLRDNNNIFFGHDTDSGDMFGVLRKYRDIKNVRKAPTIVLDSLTGRTVWLVFAVYICEPDYGYVDPNVTGESFGELLEEIRERSLYDINVDVTSDDRIITLSTCANYIFNDARLAVHARLLREGEVLGEYTAEKNPDPKPYNVPKQTRLSNIPAARGSVVKHPLVKKEYIYQPKPDGIDWYISIGGNVQGAYTAFEGTLAADSSVASLYVTSPQKRVWLAVDRLNKKPGVYLLKSSLANGPFTLHSAKPVTPAGVDARLPMLAAEGDTLWLCYVVREDGQENLYRLPLKNGAAGGQPELLLSRPEGTGLSPVALMWRSGHPLLVWIETKKQMYCRWLEDGIDHSLGAANIEKAVMYGDLTTGNPKMMTEKGGKLTLTTFDTARVPPLARPSADPTYEPTPTPDAAEPPPDTVTATPTDEAANPPEPTPAPTDVPTQAPVPAPAQPSAEVPSAPVQEPQPMALDGTAVATQ